jgi:hypothetical protein
MATPGVAPVGSHSQTWPATPGPKGNPGSTGTRLSTRSNSSQDIQVPQGVGPPAQLTWVPARTRFAPTMLPPASNSMALAPPPKAAIVSLLHTRIQPPPAVAKVATPSGATCHG